MMSRNKNSMVKLAIILMIIGLIVALAAVLNQIKTDQETYLYSGVDCYVYYNVNISLSNVSNIIDKQGFSSEIFYNRESPDDSGEILDYIKFKFNYSSIKNVSGYVYNFGSSNLTIRLYYYTNEKIHYMDKTEEEVRSLTYNQYITDRNEFEPDVDYIISIFNLELNSKPRSVNYVQLIEHSIIMWLKTLTVASTLSAIL